MRVISGKYGGRVLKKNIPNGTRPTTDKSRESLFSMLNNYIYFENKKVLDCYAGSGLVGVEFLSRGSKHCTFVERGGKQITNLKIFIDDLSIPKENYNIIKTDVIRFLHSSKERYNIIFSDAPYSIKSANQIIDIISNNDLLLNEGFLVLETSKEEEIEINNKFKMIKEKIFGTSKITLLEYTC